jgi:hypothetical protein
MIKLFKRLIDFIINLFKKLKQEYSLYQNQSFDETQKHGVYIKQSNCGKNMSKCKLKYY